MTDDRAQLDGRAHTIAIAVVVVLGLVAVAWTVYDSQPAAAVDLDEACKDELGDEWDSAGYAEFPGADHIDVKCTRSTGWFSNDVHWVSVPVL